LDDENANRGGETSRKTPREGSSEPHAPRGGSGDTTELHGELPPSVPHEKSEEKLEEPGPKAKATQRELSKWGPWKRWSWYRKIRQRERDEPSIWSRHDPDQNVRGRLPDDEDVQVPAIWVVELYTPSTVSGLLDGIRHLGWDYGRSRDDSLTKWMSDVREGRRAGWTSLGLVSSLAEARVMRERTSPLPAGVKAASPILMSLTPSLTAFVVVFLLDDDAADSLGKPLRAEFMTTTRRDPLFRPWHVIRFVLLNGAVRFGRRIYDPDFTRLEAVRSCLRNLESCCVAWVHEHLPGTFSSLGGARNPTAALLVTEQVRPLSEQARAIRALSGLAIDRYYDAWESNEWPGARLVLPRGWDDEGSRLVFACRRRDAFPDRPGYPDPTSNWTIAQRADDLVRGLLSRWALSCLLDSYHEALSVLRDQTALNSRYWPVRDLKRLRSLARTILYDIGACSQEIAEFAESDHLYRHDVLKMVYVREVRGKKRELLAGLKSSQIQRARQVHREADLLRLALSTSNDLSQIISNIRIQRLLVWLTIVSVGIAFWAAFLALHAAK